MSHIIKSNKGLLAATILMLAGGQGVLAHTRLETAVAPEATRVHNYVNIGHGCVDPTGAVSATGSAIVNQATRGTSVVFPNAISYTPIIGVDSTSDGKGTDKVYTTNKADTYYSPLAGIGQLIRGSGLWASNIKVDEKNNKDGFWAGGLAYDQSIATTVQVPFYSAAVSIVSTSCARSVTFELAIADVCDVNAKSPNIGDAQAIIWSPIPNFTGVPGQPFGVGVADSAHAGNPVPAGSRFSNYDGWSNGDKVGMGTAAAKAGDGWNSPATLKITRDLVKNPLPANCTGNGGKGDDVYIYPSAEQINKELPAWSNANQTGTVLWQ